MICVTGQPLDLSGAKLARRATQQRTGRCDVRKPLNLKWFGVGWRYYLRMKSGRLLAVSLVLSAGSAHAGTEVVVTAGGGLTGETVAQECLVDSAQASCPAGEHAGVAMLGLGITRVADDGVRGSLHLEGGLTL